MQQYGEGGVGAQDLGDGLRVELQDVLQLEQDDHVGGHRAAGHPEHLLDPHLTGWPQNRDNASGEEQCGKKFNLSGKKERHSQTLIMQRKSLTSEFCGRKARY